MIIRVVRMVFDPGFVPVFETLFHEKRNHIRGQPGCLHLQLWQQPDQPNVFMTYSQWTDEDALNTYRHTTLFKDVWAKTKAGFADRAQAWTMVQRDVVNDGCDHT